MWLQLGLVLSALAAAILAWCVTYLFFRGMRDEAALTVQRKFREENPPSRNRAELDDAHAEDSLVEKNTDIQIDADRRRPQDPRP